MRRKSKVLSALILLLFFTTSAIAQKTVTVSGKVYDKAAKAALSFVNVVIKTTVDSAFVTGTITDDDGIFSISGIKPGDYFLEISFIGYRTNKIAAYVGNLSNYLDLKVIELEPDIATLREFEVIAKQDAVGGKLDKKTYSVADNISQGGGSVLQAMQNLPGITVSEGKVQLRGNDKVAVLMDGKQTALTGFGSQAGLDNLPSSAIEKIEIINNPSAKFDANGNAGIINIVLKKNVQEGLSGKAGISRGAGALWERQENLPTIRPQYKITPKINPSLSLNYRKRKVNAFVQADNLYTQTLNKNEFVTRTYNNGTVIEQQTVRNRNTNYFTSKAGLDWYPSEQNRFTVSGLFGSEKIIDRGDEPFFNEDFSTRLRLWEFLEDEIKTTVMATAAFEHKYAQPGRLLNIGFNYTFHREDEQYFFTNNLPTYTGEDAFKLLSDESVADFNLDYTRPLKYGKAEAGFKFRRRGIPTNMEFFPGLNSPLDTNAGGWATYKETIPAAYGNYVFENKKIEVELGLRVEYVKLDYDVNPDHSTYTSDGYNYTQPFPNMRFAYKVNENSKFSLFYNRRVDRPNEVDIRIFPKYDDVEIVKVGNPTLSPQFTNSMELGYKTSRDNGYFYAALYHRMANGTITRIATTVPGSTLIYTIFQNVDKSTNSGIELVYNHEVSKRYILNANINAYYNQIDAYTVQNLYPIAHIFSAPAQHAFSGNAKLNNNFHLNPKLDAQVTVIYLAPDILPQGRIQSRFSVDCGLKRAVQKGKGELFVNATDLFNTLKIKQEIQGNGFSYTSRNYYETQVVRAGYTYKF